MNHVQFDSLVSGHIRRVESLDSILMMDTKAVIRSSCKIYSGLENRELEEKEAEQGDSVSPRTFKKFMPDALKEEKECDAIFLTDEEYATGLSSDNYNETQDTLMYYLEKEVDFPSLLSDCDELNDITLSSCSTDPSSPEILWKNFRSNEKIGESFDHSMAHESPNISQMECCSFPDSTTNNFAVSKTFHSLDYCSIDNQERVAFSNTFKFFCEISRDLDDLRKIITENNREIILPHLQRLCLPVLKYFKRPRHDTL